MESNEDMDLAKKLWKCLLVISPVIIAPMGSWFATIWEVDFPIIPKDKWYDVNLLLYSAILTALVSCIDGIIKYIDGLKSVVKIEYSLTKGEYYGHDMLSCPFKSDVANVFARITLQGNPKKFKGLQLKIIFPIQVGIQKMENYSKYLDVSDAEKTISIDLNSIYNVGKTKNISDNIEVGFIAVKLDETVDSSIETVLVGGKRYFLELENSIVTFTK